MALAERLGRCRSIAGRELLLGFEFAVALGVDLQREGLLLLVAQDGYLHRLALVGTQGAVPSGKVGHRLRAYLENDVEGLAVRRAAASLLRATCLTMRPLGTPRYSAICEVSGSTRAPTFRLLPKKGR